VDKNGTISTRLRLKSVPVQKLFPTPKQPRPTLLPAVEVPISPEAIKQYGKLKPGDSAPVPLETPEAEWPPELRGVAGSSLVSLVVDAQGQPKAMRVVRGTNEQFNEKALEAVEKYRFTPAKKGDDPVPVRMSIVVNFRPF
jgi:TonB family protein